MNIPSCLIANKELILKGDQATIWGILNCLRKLYPDALPRDRLLYFENTLPYTPQEMVKLETNLLDWMFTLGALNQYRIQPKRFIDIENELKNGIIY